MEYLSRCLDELDTVPDFNFHPRCEKLHLSHLMFVDDWLLFARADDCSVKLLLQAFTKFSLASGLSANLDKSEAYFGGIYDQAQGSLLNILGMVPGSIPFRYLGVPLSSKKLTIGGWDKVRKGPGVQIKKIYRCLRPQAPKVPWKRLFCNSHASPKSIFILWLSLWNRLMTKDMLLSWNWQCDPICVLCLTTAESRNNTVFTGCCSPAKTVVMLTESYL
ncbi:uncharacterized protein LOC110701646 [Chenopodium quinoa]|uniref:uncharacterized protein LOC110701646 n=1 Tax=Chenopodium quinoa TaxID=63459 RepID=UPI000B78E0CE|nr:uncharacterized protein LOC110701646 [Chenopodium quinoa]